MKRADRQEKSAQSSTVMEEKKSEPGGKVDGWLRQRGDLNRRGYSPRGWEQDDGEGH